MNFWSGMAAVAAKEFRHLWRDPYTLVLAFVVPVLAFLLFGYALKTDVVNVPLAVQNADAGPYGDELIEALQRSPVFRLVARASSEHELLALLRRGGARVAIQIPAHYSAAIFYGRAGHARLWADGSDGVIARAATGAAQAIALRHAASIATLGASGQEKAPAQESPFGFSQTVLYNPEARSANYFGPALMALFSEMTTILLAALSMAKEFERGTLDQLRATVLPVTSVIAGKLITCSAVGLAVALVLLLLMQAVFHVAVAGSILLLLATFGLGQAAAMGLGLILTAESRNQAQALQLTYLVFLPSILISGMVFPRETMPPLAQAVGDFLPATWSIGAARAIILRGSGWGDLQNAFAAIPILALIYFAIGTWHLTRRLR